MYPITSVFNFTSAVPKSRSETSRGHLSKSSPFFFRGFGNVSITSVFMNSSSKPWECSSLFGIAVAKKKKNHDNRSM